MAVLSDFLAAINQIAAERGIDPDDVLEAVKEAIRTSFRNNYNIDESLIIEIDKEKGNIQAFADKKVVKKVTNSSTQIPIKDAKKIEPKLKVGDHIQVDITPEGNFGRIAVQATKQVILQKIRESEKEAVMKDFKDKIGTVESGIIQRMEGDNVIVEIRKANAVMPPEERLPREFYKGGTRLKFFLKKIQRTVSGKQLIVSRSAPQFLEELFALEVPEIRSGSVEIKSVAREAGSRSKVAVTSNQEGVDPIGACVGQKGIRIENITDELKGEKIDIILWDDNTDTFISNSLSPAQAGKIEIDKKSKTSKVTVPNDQLSLAIGKDGQNVRLAAKLTGWRIDIEGEEKEIKEDDKKSKKKEKDSKSKSRKKKIKSKVDKSKKKTKVKSEDTKKKKKNKKKKEEKKPKKKGKSKVVKSKKETKPESTDSSKEKSKNTKKPKKLKKKRKSK